MWVTSAGRGRVADTVLLKEETAFGEGAHHCGDEEEEEEKGGLD